MKNFDQISDTITSYVSGRLSGEGLESFMQKMQDDPDLKEEVAFRRLVAEGAKAFGNEQLRNQIRQGIEEASEEDTSEQKQQQVTAQPPNIKTLRPKIIPMRRRLMAIAAAIMVLVVAGMFRHANNQYSNQALVADNHAMPSPAILLKGGDADDTKNIFAKAADACSTKDYEKGIALLASVPPSDAAYNKAQFHLGNLYLTTEQPKKAIGVFSSLKETGDVRYAEDTDWLLILAFLQNGDLEKVKLGLDAILQNPDHSLFNQASSLQKKLNSAWRGLVF